MAELRQRQERVAGVDVFWHEADAATPAPVLYVHGVPTDADDWLPFLELTGGIALDLPGFGRSGKGADFSYTIDGYRRFLGEFADHVGLDRFSLLVHDWGGVGLALAQDRPDRVDRLVVMDCVPLLPGYRWHRVAQVWRRPVAGELFMGIASRRLFGLFSREWLAAAGPAPAELIDRIWSRFDHGTQRAILRLYRSAPPAALAAAGARLGEIQAPALVVWGERDPYLPIRFAHAYGDALGGPARVEIVPGARHWPWLDRPEKVADIARFLAGES